MDRKSYISAIFVLVVNFFFGARTVRDNFKPINTREKIKLWLPPVRPSICHQFGCTEILSYKLIIASVTRTCHVARQHTAMLFDAQGWMSRSNMKDLHGWGK